MKKTVFGIMFLIVLFCASVYAQGVAATQASQTKTVDVNKDGNPDITYYSDGEYLKKIEADTNYDDIPDVIVYLTDGKFARAEADTNFDGKMDKKFSSAQDFKDWINSSNPDFSGDLDWYDWKAALLKF